MTSVTTKPDSSQPAAETAVYLFDNWFDPIEGGLRDRVREVIHAMIEGVLDVALSRPRYARHAKSPNGEAEEAVGATGHRHGHRSRSLLGSFGRVELEVPRARLNTPDGKTTEWKSKALRAYQRRTLVADALIASTYLAGTNTRRVRRALGALFGGAVGKDTVSRVWRKVKGDWDAWNARSLTDPIVRLILDGTVVRVRLDRKATAISLLVVIGVRADGQKMLIAIKSMGGESTEAWRAVLDDLIQRGLRRPEFLIIDGASGLENAIAAVWDGVPVQRCTVHKHRNLLAHAPERLREEITADYNDMIYAATREEIHAWPCSQKNPSPKVRWMSTPMTRLMRSVSLTPGMSNNSATRGSIIKLRRLSMRLLPRRSGTAIVFSSMTRTKPLGSPRGEILHECERSHTRAQNMQLALKRIAIVYEHGGRKMAVASIQRTLAALAVAACLFGPISIATAENLFKIPGTNYYTSLNAAQPLNTADSQPLLAAIADWLSKEFGLPVVDRFPEIKLISPGKIGALRYNSPGPPASHEVARDPRLAQPQSSAYLPTNDTVAVYIDGAEIIYLIEGWTGRTPADLSVLVHEMVHHFQYKLGLKHECPEDREKLAYAAQDRWLQLFGHSLESDFGLDGFSVLVKTHCLH